MKRISSLIIVLFLIIIISCKFDNNSSKPGDNSVQDDIVTKKYKSLYGVWDWVNSTGGIAGNTVTPEKVGYKVSIIFNAADLYQVKRNDTLYEYGQYQIEWTKHPYRQDSVFLLTVWELYSNGALIPYGNIYHTQEIKEVGKDSIVFLPPGADFYNPMYVKKK